MLPKIKVEFCITGIQLNPERITQLIGISPSQTWNIEEPIQNTLLRRKHNGWCLSSGDYKSDLDLAKLAKQLLQILLPKSEVINKTCDEFQLDCELSCVAYIVDETPIINFTHDILSGLAQLKATMDIDIILTEQHDQT